ncbi:MAG: tetratricopeptide repeat protein [Bryobacteraceae bacterium]
MSRNRYDAHKSKQRRDRIRREKNRQPEPPIPEIAHPFAAERAMRGIHALMKGQQFENAGQINAKLAELAGEGRVSEMAAAWKQDDPKWRAQELAYDALETDDLVEALSLINEALQLDPDCTDAQRLMVSLVPASLDNKIHLMREVVEKAEANLGEEFFRENLGHFWGTISTRPYMRAKQHLGELLVESGDFEAGAEVFRRMLELNPGDNQGIRYELLALYLALRQPQKAGELMSCYPDEDKTFCTFAWGRVMARWQAGETREAELALARARKVNPYAERYFSGARKAPANPPPFFRPGEDSEAQTSASELALALKHNPGFCDWLRERQ